MKRLLDKVALISGGTSGIGAETAKLFVAEGATVIATGHNPASLEAARRNLPGVEIVASDATEVAAIRALVADVKQRHSRIDILVVNAGLARYAPIETVDEAFFDTLFAINTRGPYFLMQEAAKAMPDGGSIVLTSSNAHALGMSALSVYGASKAALRALGRTFAAELAPRRIRVNTVSPGPIVTPMWGKATGASPEQLAAMEQQIAARIPLKRAGRPAEVAPAVLYFASDEASFTTGVDLHIDGGILDLGYAQ